MYQYLFTYMLMHSLFISIVTKMIKMQNKMEQLASDEKDLKQRTAEQIAGKKL